MIVYYFCSFGKRRERERIDDSQARMGFDETETLIYYILRFE